MQINKLLQTLMLTAGLISVGAAFAAGAAEPAANANPQAAASKTIATVNGTPINQLAADLLKQERMSRGMQPDTSTDQAIRDSLVTAEVLAQEAVRKGLDKDPVVIAVLDLQRKEILGKALLEKVMDAQTISEDRLKSEYEKAKAKAGDTEYLSRHILVDDEKLAKDIVAKLGAKKPVKFEELAKQHSKDSSAAKGGELGWMNPANLVPEFAAAMTQLKKGEYTKAPVKTQFGWHVIRLDDTRKLNLPGLDKVKSKLTNQLVQQDVRKYIAELVSTAKIDTPAK